MTDHLDLARKARDAGDSQARADHIRAWLAEDPGRTQTQAAEIFGISRQWLCQILARKPDRAAGRARQARAAQLLGIAPDTLDEILTLPDAKQALDEARKAVEEARRVEARNRKERTLARRALREDPAAVFAKMSGQELEGVQLALRRALRLARTQAT